MSMYKKKQIRMIKIKNDLIETSKINDNMTMKSESKMNTEGVEEGFERKTRKGKNIHVIRNNDIIIRFIIILAKKYNA